MPRDPIRNDDASTRDHAGEFLTSASQLETDSEHNRTVSTPIENVDHHPPLNNARVIVASERSLSDATREDAAQTLPLRQLKPDAVLPPRTIATVEHLVNTNIRASKTAKSSIPELLQRNPGAAVTKVGEEGLTRMHRFVMYETSNFYYIVGSDIAKKSFRILKINRAAEEGELDITEDEIVYTQKEKQQILIAIDDGNRATGGLKVKKTEFWGLLGFVKFTGPYYMVCINNKSHVAVVGGHYIEKIDATEMIQLSTSAASKNKLEKYLEESRLVSIFNQVDLSKAFYFSASYNITRTLQHNILREKQAIEDGEAKSLKPDHNDMFVWNHHLLGPAQQVMQNPFDWCMAVIHGYIDQIALKIFWSRVVYITLVARRSRFFAGARFLKRGANDLGHVANDVETEQIVSEMRTQSLHAPESRLFSSPCYTSHIQHRGSIPLYWTQDTSGVQPKPDINLNISDPFYTAAALHFDNLFQRYGTPICVLNLVKQKERKLREGKLGPEYQQAIEYLNQFLPDDKQIFYSALDMSRAAKSKEGRVIEKLAEKAETLLLKTGFFHNAANAEHGLQLQHGVVRTNCVDCLDRTNAAQFVVAKKALALQLRALGVIEDGQHIEYETDAANMLTSMWHDHGDTIALQYGGSHLVNTMSTYRKINEWQSHSRDMIESFRRFYNNSFMDTQRQEAYNLFLGNYIYKDGVPLLWEMSSDYFLHHTEPKSMFGKARPDYQDWYTHANVEKRMSLPSTISPLIADRPLKWFDDYYGEYYRPYTTTSLEKLFTYKMNNNYKHMKLDIMPVNIHDSSPFKVRSPPEHNTNMYAKPIQQKHKGVKIVVPSEEKALSRASTVDSRLGSVDEPEPQALCSWLDAQNHRQLQRRYTGIIKDSSWEKASRTPIVPQMPSVSLQPGEPTKQELAIHAFTQMVASSLNPHVSEVEEYEQYMTHPLDMPLVTSTEQDMDYRKIPRDMYDYIFQTSGVRDMTPDLDNRAEMNRDDYQDYYDIGLQDGPLNVTEEDGQSKRYKAYRQWLRGKSLFKQKYAVAGEVV